METTAQKILGYTEALAEGETVSAKELLHLGSRAAIDQALSRLVKRGRLLRVGRGVYARSVQSRFGARAPRPITVLENLKMRTGEAIAPSGAAAANSLGLTTQNPVRTVFATSGRSRTLTIGSQKIELRHAPNWQLRAPNSKAGEAFRALVWLGPKNAKGKAKRLETSLSQAERQELVAMRAQSPTWLAQELSTLAVNG